MKTCEQNKNRGRPSKVLTLTLPNGEKIPVRIPSAPKKDSNLEEFVISKCQYHIPISAIKASLNNNLWPSPAVLEKEPGSNEIRGGELWRGSQQGWEKIRNQHKTQEQNRIDERKKIVTDLKNTKKVLRNISLKEWTRLQSFLSINKATGLGLRKMLATKAREQ